MTTHQSPQSQESRLDPTQRPVKNMWAAAEAHVKGAEGGSAQLLDLTIQHIRKRAPELLQPDQEVPEE